MKYKDNYKHLAFFYDNILGGNYEKYGKILNSVMSTYFSKTDLNILDIGCGTGGILNYINNSAQVDGIDISNEMLDIARINFPNNNFMEQSFLDIKYHKDYDFVYSIYDSLNHVEKQEYLFDLIKGVNNNLNDKGVFFFDLNTLFKFKSFNSDYFHVIQQDNGVLTINREFMPPDKGAWNIDTFSNISDKERIYEKKSTSIIEISFDLEVLYKLLKTLFSNVKIYNLDHIEMNIGDDITLSQASSNISRLGFLCVK